MSEKSRKRSPTRGGSRPVDLAPVPEAGARRDLATRFVKGQSGNPAGRPRGSQNRVTKALRLSLEDAGAEIISQLVSEAKAGKAWALKLSVDRLIKLRPDRHVDLGLRAARTAQDLAEATAQCIMLAGSGEISIEDAREFMKLLEQQRRVVETNDIAARLELLDSEDREGKIHATRRRIGYKIGDED